ncbi:hypothetical protein, partial [Acinetobacter baumannii]|uniref:hypothetical protein n=1 Tax=Acinetobacter baumannii TaxID=470 RepID=UPI001BC87A78
MATFSFLEIRMRRSTGAPGRPWKSETIVREAMHEPYEPSIGHLGGRQSYHSYSDRFVMQE